MPQVPLTPAGVQQKITEVYALSDPQLTVQADAIRSDFRQWVKDNFSLANSQLTYLDGMAADWLQFAGDITSMAFKYRRPVDLLQLGTGLSKLIRTHNNLTADNLAGGGVSVDGSVTFEIIYQ